MRALADFRPREGLSVPLLTVLDARGGLDEASQRRLVRHVISGGFGADILFPGGTTGEALAFPGTLRRRLAECVVEEARGSGCEVWVGVSARTCAETLDLLAHAVRAGADAAVIAPLTVADRPDTIGFFQGEVRDVLESGNRMIPVFLYDNADIAADPRVPHLRTAVVKRLSRLEFVRGVKVSASMKVLGNYARAAGHFHARGAFGIYTGNARLVFDIFDTAKGPFRRSLDRSLLQGSLPVGVVAGHANALPREWQAAWRAAVAGIDTEAARFRDGFARLSEACRPSGTGGRTRTIACLKRALARAGILASDAVAPGTPPLPPEETRAFDQAFAGVRALLAEGAPARRVTPWPSPADTVSV